MYEHRNEPLLPRRLFYRRLFKQGILVFLLILLSLTIGMLGYHIFQGLPWIDSLLNAAMILGGMGQIDPIYNVAGKLFASAYALFAGIAFLGISSVAIAPVAHRFLHNLHIEEGKKSSKDK